jgi:hypothetical protein
VYFALISWFPPCHGVVSALQFFKRPQLP